MSASSPSPASAAPGGPSTPNCQRTWFLRGGPVRVEQVALVEHRVGGEPGERGSRVTPPACASSALDRVVPGGEAAACR